MWRGRDNAYVCEWCRAFGNLPTSARLPPFSPHFCRSQGERHLASRPALACHPACGPACRPAAHLEDRHGSQEEVGLWEEVGVEDCDKLARDGVVDLVHRARLVALPVGAADRLDLHALCSPVRDALIDDLPGLWIRRVVEALDVDLVLWVVHPAGVVDDATRDECLVEHGQLHAHGRHLGAFLPPARIAQSRLPRVWEYEGHGLVEDACVE